MDTGGYYIDLTAIDLDTLKSRLRGIHLSPGQQILLEKLDERFEVLKRAGFENLQQVRVALKNKKKVEKTAAELRLPADYLIHLRRWVNGYFPNPVKLKELPGVDAHAVQKLADIGITDTLQLFPEVKNQQLRNNLATQIGIPVETILQLAQFTDLVRLKWVGPKFAALLIAAGFDDVEKVANVDGEALFAHLQQVKAEVASFKGNFSLDDIRLWVQYIVCDVPINMEF